MPRWKSLKQKWRSQEASLVIKGYIRAIVIAMTSSRLRVQGESTQTDLFSDFTPAVLTLLRCVGLHNLSYLLA
jgi:hypothetical protein